MKKDEILKAADKLANAYRAWIVANAKYNALLIPDSVDNTYTINWTAGMSFNKRAKKK